MQAKVQNTKRIDDIYKRDRNIKWRKGRTSARKRDRSQIVFLANPRGWPGSETTGQPFNQIKVSKGTKPGRI